jgi:hypothetical protein
MKRLAVAALMGASLVWGQSAQADVMIDTFSTTQEVFVNPGTPTASSELFAGEAIGDYRDIYLNLSSAEGSAEAKVGTSVSNTLTYSSGFFSRGNALITWDGNDVPDDASPGGIQYTGLGGLNLSESGGNSGIYFMAGSDLGAILTFTVYTDGSNYSTATKTIAAGTMTPQMFYIPFVGGFTPTGSGADFTNVGAITLYVNGDNPEFEATDVSIDNIQATHMPEPTSMSVLLLGTGIAGFLKRRKRA